jgi:hypothetical protein
MKILTQRREDKAEDAKPFSLCSAFAPRAELCAFALKNGV